MTSGKTGRLANKRALITGAAKGIGAATARLFAAEGARLVLSDIDENALSALGAELREAGHELRTTRMDVSNEEDIKAAVALSVEAFGGLDILVANAGIIPEATLDEATAALWDHTMAVDGRGMFLSCKYAAEEMVKAGSGAIVCLSSVSAFAGQPGQAVYGPAKYVASGITKHLAIDLADKGVRVNAVAPGTIATPAVAALDEAGIARVVSMHPIGRIGQPEEVAPAIAFLASDEASFITGAVLPVDGGYLAQ
ncbi:SDR family NAD(P)-dependent oxidoreductase [Swaminathania salitolerans]|uniref:Short-chain dehydrogenase n=1 Tax=Swaminathania salitolerans TaxID=182838 RepID=A0A511BVF3_9PROT|nr:SDR family NAD(P)-dependent oxidoreductase [Swaminathania salitolerans]GBQ15059.1 oxidoreductase [Swaminathania salitolerans LMG 21291]GEL01978.1 short-chain dehydrogenase [Swaminathania salitolerans]